jgi:UDP-N-acetylglucosamine 1-carboxyvinyltransferase
MEDSFIINGGKVLKGEITLSGAKNVALKVIIAALFFDQEVIFHNIPHINDVEELFNLINSLGGTAKFIDKNSVIVDGRSITNNKVEFLYGSKIRVSFMFLAPLVYKFRQCFIPNPGGCRIGARPIDRIIEGVQYLGGKITYNSETGYYQVERNQYIGGHYTFPKTSHTGTELLILFSLFGDKEVILENTALEPEIDNLILFLNVCGAKIVRNNRKILIQPVKKLIQKKPFSIMTDRNEAVTYASLAVASKGEVIIHAIQSNVIESFLCELKNVGAEIKTISDVSMKFQFKNTILPSHIKTMPFPGFMTDWQPNWAVLMTQAKGESTIVERVFENRFSYVPELQKLGAKIKYINNDISNPETYYFFNYEKGKTYQQAIKIYGGNSLHNGVLQIADLRAGATLAIAALLAHGESIINNAHILERGYENFVKKVQGLGGNIKKV